MKKFFSFLVAILFYSISVSAQTQAIVGDMNNDGELTIEDITLLTETILGNKAQQTITIVPIERTVVKPTPKDIEYSGNRLEFGEVFNNFESDKYEVESITKDGNQVDEIKDAGDYVITISPKDGYVWEDTNNNDSYVITITVGKKPVEISVELNKTENIQYGDTLVATPTITYDTDELTYAWYIVDYPTDKGTTVMSPDYQIDLNDSNWVSKYVYLEVSIKETDNYESATVTTPSYLVNKKSVRLSFEDNVVSGTIDLSEGTYILPNVVYDPADYAGELSYLSDKPEIADVSNGVITLKDAGTVRITVTPQSSDVYSYEPSTISFVLTITKPEPKIYWGMYPYWNYRDKEDRLMPIFLNGQLPDKKVEVASDATTFKLSKELYDAATGNTATVRCWWIAAPAGTKFKSALESGVNPFVVSEHQISSTNQELLNDSDKVDLDITIDGVKYDIYGSANGTLIGVGLSNWDLVVNL